jgi:hypothetical protein
MPSGGRRPGAGRPKGSKVKKTMDIAIAAAAAGETPLEYMLRVMRDESVPALVRLDLAKAAAPYMHARLASTVLNAAVEQSLTIEIRKFTYADDEPRPLIDVTPLERERDAVREKIAAVRASMDAARLANQVAVIPPEPGGGDPD